jgi:DNA invertase Pin-like site-specific DNA recombinase
MSLRCALYLRVSTGKQETANQEYVLRQFAASQGWEVCNVYGDELSGGKGERSRPGFAAMLEAASRREFDVLLFWSLDRLSREGVLPTLTYLQRLDSYGIGWRSFTEQYLDSTGMFRDAVLAILATIAKQERLRLSERTIAGLERARRQGKILGRPRVAADPEMIRTMRQEGLSWSEISRRTNVSRGTCQALAQVSNSGR